LLGLILPPMLIVDCLDMLGIDGLLVVIELLIPKVLP